MSWTESKTESIHQIETLMLEHFCTEPFHNLLPIFGQAIARTVPGGTCSDKTLAFVTAGRVRGFDLSLHSGFIGGREIHRLVRVHIGSSLYFADVGNGWPSVKLYPIDREVSFRSFGMGFRTEINNDRVSVFHERRGNESLQMEIDIEAKPESEIMADIDRRFSSGIRYPFSNSLRFSRIVGDQFLFLRGNRLDIYSENQFECLENIREVELPRVLYEYFGCTLRLNANCATGMIDQSKEPG